MKKTIVIPTIAVTTILLILMIYMFTLPDYKSFTFVGRAILWGESDVDDHQRFAYRDIHNGNESFTFEYDLQDDVIHDLLEGIQYTSNQATYTIGDAAQFLADTDTTSLIVIKDNNVIYEGYFNGYQRESIQTSFSMAKSFVSFLIGKAVEEGHIASIDEPITNYIPEWVDSDFAVITIKDLLTMSSGIRYEEGLLLGDDTKTYYSPNLRRLALEDTQYMNSPGEKFIYNNYNPLLLGIILERATQQSVSEYMQAKIWEPLGMEFSASWSIDSKKYGFEKMESGINARSIDYAKFGSLYLHNGNWNGEQVISSDWVSESTSKAVTTDDYYSAYSDWDFIKRGTGYYKYMWYGYERENGEDDFFAHGKYGQVIYVSPKYNSVIVRNGITSGEVDWWPELLFELASKLK